MSVFFGAAMLRMRPLDMALWPVSYQELEPFYLEAERLLEVHGEVASDPCEPPRSGGYPYTFADVPLAPPSQRILDAAKDLGYQPFRVPLAINFANRARPTCQRCATCDGFPCAISAKNDATTLLAKAGPLLQIRTGVIARRLLFSKSFNRTIAIECIDKATSQIFHVPTPGVVVLSTGTLQSPALLLRSDVDRFPQRAFIGRYLMRHCNSFLTTLFPFRTTSQDVFHKQVCLSDFYEDLRAELGTATGTIQDMTIPSTDVLRHYAPGGAKFLAGAVARHLQGLLCVAEDDPQERNRVALANRTDDFGLPIVQVDHQYSNADHRRRFFLQRHAKRILCRAGGFLSHVFMMDSFAHAVGTLRFAADPQHGALDRDCRFFGVPNLFVADGSFMPTASGVNPGLTIVANGLRVANHLIANLGALRG